MQKARHLKKSFNQLGKYCLSSISLAEFRSLQFSSPPVMPVSKVYAFPFMQYRCPVYALGNVEVGGDVSITEGCFSTYHAAILAAARTLSEKGLAPRSHQLCSKRHSKLSLRDSEPRKLPSWQPLKLCCQDFAAPVSTLKFKNQVFCSSVS